MAAYLLKYILQCIQQTEFYSRRLYFYSAQTFEPRLPWIEHPMLQLSVDQMVLSDKLISLHLKLGKTHLTPVLETPWLLHKQTGNRLLEHTYVSVVCFNVELPYSCPTGKFLCFVCNALQ